MVISHIFKDAIILFLLEDPDTGKPNNLKENVCRSRHVCYKRKLNKMILKSIWSYEVYTKPNPDMLPNYVWNRALKVDMVCRFHNSTISNTCKVIIVNYTPSRVKLYLVGNLLWKRCQANNDTFERIFLCHKSSVTFLAGGASFVVKKQYAPLTK